MNENEHTTALTHEERLKAIAFQFVALYERWSEDRQVAAKQGADTADLVKLFTEQVKEFKTLEPSIREQIKSAVHTAAIHAAKAIAEEASKTIFEATGRATVELKQAAAEAKNVLNIYQDELKAGKTITILATIFASILTCVVLVWFFTPKPALPLTQLQLNELQTGYSLAEIWPKLSKHERHHLLDLEYKEQTKELSVLN